MRNISRTADAIVDITTIHFGGKMGWLSVVEALCDDGDDDMPDEIQIWDLVVDDDSYLFGRWPHLAAAIDAQRRRRRKRDLITVASFGLAWFTILMVVL